MVIVMYPGESRNLPGPLEAAEAVFRDYVAQLPPVSEEVLAQRARHFARGVRLSLAEPGAMRRLHEVTGGIRSAASLRTLLPRVLDGALSLMRADFGSLQLLDPASGSLRLVTQSGFNSEFLDYFAVVNDDHSVCGQAARGRIQIVITDVNADPGFAPHRGIAAASGFRAVQATPLVDYAGRLVGMISTHFRRPHRPPDLDLQTMRLYADFAGDAIARHLGALDACGLGDPIGRAVISALLDPGDRRESRVTVPSVPGGPGSPGRRPMRAAVPAEDRMAQFTHYVVTRLFSVSLSLEGARSILREGPANDRVAAATDEIDRMIRDVRTMMVGLAAGRETHTPVRPSLPPAGAPVHTAELLDGVVTSILQASLLLQAAADLPRDTAELRITQALHRLDEVVREVRDHAFAGYAQESEPGLAGRSPHDHERPWPTADRAAGLKQRVAQTAHALQTSAADAAALIENRAAIARVPGRMDYRAESKRWRAFADQAGQMAERWEQPP